MKKILALLIITAIINESATAQGCVAIRSPGAGCTRQEADANANGGWQLNTSYRFKGMVAFADYSINVGLLFKLK